MISTGCEGCCFLQDDDSNKGCALMQLCLEKDGKIFAPGYCRSCRSQKWVTEQGTQDTKDLHKKVIKERELKFDLLVTFDEAQNTIDDLRKTLCSDWYRRYVSKIIIMDVTGFGSRNNTALQYLKSKEHTIPMVVDSSTEHETPQQQEDTIRRLSKQVSSPFFLVVPAGLVVNNIDKLAIIVQQVPSRVIHWSFPTTIGATVMVSNKLQHGLFITAPYVALTKFQESSTFTKRLRIEEDETQMGLTWFCAECCLV